MDGSHGFSGNQSTPLLNSVSLPKTIRLHEANKEASHTNFMNRSVIQKIWKFTFLSNKRQCKCERTKNWKQYNFTKCTLIMTQPAPTQNHCKSHKPIARTLTMGLYWVKHLFLVASNASRADFAYREAFFPCKKQGVKCRAKWEVIAFFKRHHRQ
jgi:hypothetical protein